jgi:hypothetical protein
MTTKHTPTPWKYRYSKYQEYVIDGDGIDCVAVVVDEKDAAFIVKAVNTHAELVACLELMHGAEINKSDQFYKSPMAKRIEAILDECKGDA